mgnify:CR=1 FL=1
MYYSYSAAQWLLVFYLYCMLGWCFESTVVSVGQRRLVNRGFLRGPMLPIYGFGAVILLHVSLPLKQHPVWLYLASMIAATVFEYIVGVVMEKIFKVKYWDYSKQRFQFQGYVCLRSSLCWGFLGLILTSVIHPPIEKLVLGLPFIGLIVIDVLFSAAFISDVIVSVRSALDLAKVLEELDRLREQGAELRQQLSETALVGLTNLSYRVEEAHGEFTEKVGEAKAQLAERVDDAREQLADAKAQLSEKMDDAKEQLAAVMEQYDIQWEQKGTHEKHLSVLDYKKQEREKEIAALDSTLAEKQDELETVQNRIDNFDQGAHSIERLEQRIESDAEFQLPDPPTLMTAKTYKQRFVDPLIRRLKEIIREVFYHYYKALDSYHRLNTTNGRLYRENEHLTTTNDRLKGENDALRSELKDFRFLRKVLGSQQIDSLITQAKDMEQQRKQTQRTRRRNTNYER